METLSRFEDNDGIIKEIMKTPMFKDILKNHLRSTDRSSGRKTTKTILWQDPEVLLGLTGSMPDIINLIVDSLDELGEQLKEKYPPELIAGLMESLYKDIDRSSLKRCINTWSDLGRDIWSSSSGARSSALNAIQTKGPGFIAGALNNAAKRINSIEAENPQLISAFLKDTISNIDGPEFNKASHTLTNAILDQKWGITSWLFERLRMKLHKLLQKTGIL